MKAASQSLVFVWTPLSLAVSILFVGLVAWLAWTAWQRSGFRRATGWLEALRVVIAVGIALTLNQPEWREIFKPDSKPTLAVLVDASRSMQTLDVFDPHNPSAEPTSRADATKPFLDPAAWSSLMQKMEVVVEPFSSDAQPPEDGTDIGGALAHAAQQHPHLRAVALVSDGDWNTGDPPSQSAMKLRMRDVPVFAVPVGSESRLPDVELSSFDVPTFAVAGKPLRIPFTIESSLPQDAPATLEMKSSTGETITKDVIIPAMSRLQDVTLWKPESPGDIKLTLTIPHVGNQHNLENKSIQAPLSVRKEELHVLVIESFPRWEYRYLRNALERDPGIQVNTLLFHPDLGKVGAGRGYLAAFPKDEQLAKYDVIFLGNVGTDPGQLMLEQCDSLMKAVRDQAIGLVFIPGFHGFEASLMQTPLGDLFPVVWDDAQPRGYGTSAPGGFVLTEAGKHSLLTKLEDTDEASEQVWKDLPGFQWYAPALREGRHGSPRHPQHGKQQLWAHSAHRDAHLRRGKNPLHGHRRRVALAQGRRGPLSLSLLGPGGALDGLSAQHVAGRQDAALLFAGPSARGRRADAERERDERHRRAAAGRRRDRANHRAIGKNLERAPASGQRTGVGPFHRRLHPRGTGRISRAPEQRRCRRRARHHHLGAGLRAGKSRQAGQTRGAARNRATDAREIHAECRPGLDRRARRHVAAARITRTKGSALGASPLEWTPHAAFGNILGWSKAYGGILSPGVCVEMCSSLPGVS